MDKVLIIKDIHKSFALRFARGRPASGSEVKEVVSGLDMELERGKITALVGGNGAGKTTLFNMISGLTRPDRGTIYFNTSAKEIDCTVSAPWRIAAAGIGRMFQGTRVFGDLSLEENLLLQARQSGSESPFHKLLYPVRSKSAQRELLSCMWDRLTAIEDLIELWENRTKAAFSVSFGMQRMCSLAGLMLGDYSLLLLDEPTSGLSPESYSAIYAILESLKEEGRSVFLIEHNMTFIENAADHCHFMAGGRISYSGKPAEVLTQAEVKRSYLL